MKTEVSCQSRTRFNGFRFKHFLVQHDKCAMKVGTDSIALGSWCQPGDAKRILDIGTGSGLLSLMLAQKTLPDARIIAVEADLDAVHQARENIQCSPWPEKVSVVHSTIQAWARDPENLNTKFDLIISNPPWFQYAPSQAHNQDNQYRAPQRTSARQQSLLDITTLTAIAAHHLTDNGRLFLILPVASSKIFKEVAESAGLFCQSMTSLSASPEHKAYAMLMHFSRQKCLTPDEGDVAIKDASGAYTSAFKTLCREYYLKF